MGCPTEIQMRIQNQIAVMAAGEMDETYEQARMLLVKICELSRTKVLDETSVGAAYEAVEVMVRLECRKAGGGWWYRMWRRPRLMHMALQSAAQMN